MNKKTFVFFDLDLTLADTRPVYEKHGKEPCHITNPEEFFKWIHIINQPENLLPLELIYPTKKTLDYFLSKENTEVVYLTGRNEGVRRLTQQWIKNKGLPNLPLYMRGESDAQNNGEFKINFIEKFIADSGHKVVVVDDDPANILEEECRKRNWLFIKVEIND